MVKKITVFLLVLALIMFPGCGTKNNEEPDKTKWTDDVGNKYVEEESGVKVDVEELPAIISHNGKELALDWIGAYEYHVNHGHRLVLTVFFWTVEEFTEDELYWLQEEDIDSYIYVRKSNTDPSSMIKVKEICSTRFNDGVVFVFATDEKDLNRNSFSGNYVAANFDIKQQESYKAKNADGTATYSNKSASLSYVFVLGDDIPLNDFDSFKEFEPDMYDQVINFL